MFEAIGLKSPAIENIIGLVSQNENNNNNNENKNKYDVIEEMLNMDTPIHDFENENNINFNIINPNGFNIINESNSVNSNSNSNYISNNELENEFNDEGTIGISSYICTEGADMIDDDCVLPQVMVKYIPNNNNIKAYCKYELMRILLEISPVFTNIKLAISNPVTNNIECSAVFCATRACKSILNKETSLVNPIDCKKEL
eukprot:428142_1